MIETLKTICDPRENAALVKQVECLSEWIPAYISGQAGIADLCDRFGLNCSEEPPSSEQRNAVQIDLPEGRKLFMSGEDISGVNLLEPVISSLIGICNSYPPFPRVEEMDFPEIIARSEIMLGVKHSIKKIAGTKVPVLITGETGTGKDLVVKALHRASGRAPFVTVDCGVIPENLIEAELFGSAKGSYTDSRSDRQGLIESANGGILFLDEIGNMPLHLQAKLLRVIESGLLRRIGETVERKVNFRLLSATNSDLCYKISRGEFRSDLYYRIAVMVIYVPPLRERTEDIPLLVRYFAKQLMQHGIRPPRFLKSSMNRLCCYKWPGNVRELRNIVHRSILMSSGKIIRESDIIFESTIQGNDLNINDTSMQKLEDVITHHVYRTYDLLKSKSRAAEVLQCDPKTVSKYVKKYIGSYK
jgi:transcriptional regulator of aroF, aroG, tyrA and aromatic amino acid transport